MTRINEFSQATKSEAFKRSKSMCESCGTALVKLTAVYHHIRPIQDGGSDDISNCQVLCADCHTDEFNFRDLHPNAPPRIMFNKNIPHKERVSVAKKQQQRYDEYKRDTKKRKTWNRLKDDPFDRS